MKAHECQQYAHGNCKANHYLLGLIVSLLVEEFPQIYGPGNACDAIQHGGSRLLVYRVPVIFGEGLDLATIDGHDVHTLEEDEDQHIVGV